MKKKPTKRREPKLKILPCPFCGEAPIVRRSERFDWLGAVECKRCLARVPLEATDAAIKSWNRRVSEPRPSLSRAEWKWIEKSVERAIERRNVKVKTPLMTLVYWYQWVYVRRAVNAALRRRGVR